MRARARILPQPDSSAEAAFSQGKSRSCALSLVPLSASLVPVVKRAGTLFLPLKAAPFPPLCRAPITFQHFFRLVLEVYRGPAVLMEFLVAVFSLSVKLGPVFGITTASLFSDLREERRDSSGISLGIYPDRSVSGHPDKWLLLTHRPDCSRARKGCSHCEFLYFNCSYRGFLRSAACAHSK